MEVFCRRFFVLLEVFRVLLEVLISCSYVLGVIYIMFVCKIVWFYVKRNMKVLIDKLCIMFKILIKFFIWKIIKINKIKNFCVFLKILFGLFVCYIYFIEFFS